jgi:hypothetical protein
MLSSVHAAAFALLIPTAAPSPPPIPTWFVRGDVVADGPLDLSDAVTALAFLFLGGPPPPCLSAADTNDDGVVDISDTVYLLSSLFLGGPDPASPYPACGSDPTPDGLGCLSYPICEFESVVAAYGIIENVAGRGAQSNDVPVNEWDPDSEGGPAVDAELSSPHFSMADDAGNIYIADKDANAVRKVTPDGIITTVAGTGESGDDGDDPGRGVDRRLNFPNGLWVRGDSTVYILDLGNGKVRRLSPDGTLTTLFSDPDGITGGRGLWVRDDERLVYYSSSTSVKRWTPEEGVESFSTGFLELGNLVMDPWGSLVVTDRLGNAVSRLAADGTPTIIAGNGTNAGGGDGQPALDTGLAGVRGVWFLPSGGYFLATHAGSQVWYVDTAGIIHIFVNGRKGSHSGDGDDFDSPGFKVSEVRSVTVDGAGNVLITENDAGFVRRVVRKKGGL